MIMISLSSAAWLQTLAKLALALLEVVSIANVSLASSLLRTDIPYICSEHIIKRAINSPFLTAGGIAHGFEIEGRRIKCLRRKKGRV